MNLFNAVHVAVVIRITRRNRANQIQWRVVKVVLLLFAPTLLIVVASWKLAIQSQIWILPSEFTFATIKIICSPHTANRIGLARITQSIDATARSWRARIVQCGWIVSACRIKSSAAAKTTKPVEPLRENPSRRNPQETSPAILEAGQ